MKKNMQFTYYAKIILNIFVYTLFFVYIIYFAINGEVKYKAAWVVVCIVAGLFALLYEILKYLYDSATKALVFDGNPKKTISNLEKILKFDIFKTFRSSVLMMRLLADVDNRDYDALKKDIDDIDNEKDGIRNDYDVTITKAYASMVYYGETKDKGKLKAAYKKLLQVRDTKTSKGKTHKGSYYFNWDLMNGLYEYYDENYDSAYKKLKDIDTSNMNKREAMHLYIALGDSANKTGYVSVANDSFDKAIKLAGKNEIVIKHIENIHK